MIKNMFCTKLLLLVLVVSLLSACAFTDSRVRLTYEPITHPQGGNEGSISVVKFQDARPDKRVIGEVKNLEGKHTADAIIENQDVSKWVTDALVSELSRAGYTVDEAANEAPSAIRPQVKGVLTNIFCSPDADFFYRCLIEANIQMDRGAETLLKKQFFGRGESLAEWSAEKAFEDSVKLTLQSLMTQVVSKIHNVLKD